MKTNTNNNQTLSPHSYEWVASHTSYQWRSDQRTESGKETSFLFLILMIPVLIPEALRDLMGTPGVWALSRRVDPHFSDHWWCSSNSSCAGNWDLQQLNDPHRLSFHPSCKSFRIFDNNSLLFRSSSLSNPAATKPYVKTPRIRNT